MLNAKFDRIHQLNNVFEALHTSITNYLKHPTKYLLQKKKRTQTQIAIILKLMMLCNFRIGNKHYYEKYKTYGLTTLKWKHITFKTNKVEIKFIGKKNVENFAVCTNKKIIKLLLAFKNASASESANANAFIFDVSSKEVNNFIHKFNPTMSSKDIRTWCANKLFVKEYKKLDASLDHAKKIKMCFKKIAFFLHNTPGVCKSSYIDPRLLKDNAILQN